MTAERTKALGGIQAVGMVALIEAMDAMVKAAPVELRELHDAG